jgi:hypothetical protein
VKPASKPFAEIRDRAIYVAVYASPPAIYSDDGTRKMLREFTSLDEAMRALANGVLARLENEEELSTTVYEPES